MSRCALQKMKCLPHKSRGGHNTERPPL